MNSRSKKNGKRPGGDGARELALEHEELLDPEEGQIGAGGVDEPVREIRISAALARQLGKAYGWRFPKRIEF